LPAGQHEMRVLIGFDDGAAPIRTSSTTWAL
jgi:hypothetical protein